MVTTCRERSEDDQVLDMVSEDHIVTQFTLTIKTLS